MHFALPTGQRSVANIAATRQTEADRAIGLSGPIGSIARDGRIQCGSAATNPPLPPIVMTTIAHRLRAALAAASIAVTVFLLGRRRAERSRGQARARSPLSSTSGCRRWSSDLSRGARARAGTRPGAAACSASSAARSTSTRCSRARSTPPGRSSGVDAAVVSIGAGGEPLVTAPPVSARASPPRAIAGPPDGSRPRSIVGRVRLRPLEDAVEAPARSAPGSRCRSPRGEEPSDIYSRTPAAAGSLRHSAGRRARGARPPGRARRSTTRAASARHASSPTSTP